MSSCMRGGRRGDRGGAATAAAWSRAPVASRVSARAAAGRTRVRTETPKIDRERGSQAYAAVYRTPGGAGSMLSGRTSTCVPARADPGYLEDQIAFGATLLFGNFGAEASPPFRALFLKILQDLENKRETRDSRKRARRARQRSGAGSSRGWAGLVWRAGRWTHGMH